MEQESRDLLIKVDTKVTNLCHSTEDLKQSVSDLYNKMDEHKTCCAKRLKDCNTEFSSRPRWSVILWGAGLLIMILIGITTYIGEVNEDVIRNDTRIEAMVDK